MSRTLVQRFAKSRIWLIGLSGLALFSTGTMFKDLSGQYKRAGSIQNGLQICANRAHQTYTASVIGDTSSIYMDSSFSGATEECFAEAASMMEDFKGLAPAVIKRMNSLNSNVHWFHEELRTTGKGFSVKETDSKAGIDEKYQEVETSVEATAELMSAHVESLDASMMNLKIALAMAAIILFGAGALEVFDRRRVARDRKEIEDEAYSELVSEDTSTGTKVEEIIVNALELNEMTHCSKLLTTYRQNVLKTIDNTPLRRSPVNQMAVVFEDQAEKIEDTVQKLWDESEEVTEIIATTDIEPLSSKILDHLSNKLIADGIIVDMNVNDSLIKAESESLEQILYYVLSDALSNTANTEVEEKKISINGKTLGSVYNFEVVSNGEGKDGADNTSLDIVKELLNDVSGRMEVANAYDKNKKVVGRKIRVILKSEARQVAIEAASKDAVAREIEQTILQDIAREIEQEASKEETSEKTLVRLERGTKRELLERMNG